MQVFSSSVPEPEFLEPDGHFDNDKYTERENAYLDAVKAEAKSFGDHKLAGEIVYVPFADGKATYVIAKINGKVSLIHCAIGDAWHDDRFCRLATVKELTDMVASAKRFAKAWAARSAS